MKVLLVDDHILFREGLRSLLSGLQDFNVVGTAVTLSETLEKIGDLEPDLILMDFNLSDGTGLEATHAILAEHPRTNIVFLTAHDDDERLDEAVRAGAVGYLCKNISLNKLLTYIRQIFMDNDEAVISSR